MALWLHASDGNTWLLEEPVDLDAPRCRIVPAAGAAVLEREDGASEPLNVGQSIFLTDEFSVQLQRQPRPRDRRHVSLPLIEALLAADPEEAQWLVYADQLEEDGDPRAERVRQACPLSADQARLWCPLPHTSIDWRHGFAWRAVVTPSAALSPVDQLVDLAQWEGARFLREVHVQLHRELGAIYEDRLSDWLEPMSRTPWSDTLERVSFGGLHVDDVELWRFHGVDPWYAGLRRRFPKLPGPDIWPLFFSGKGAPVLEGTNHPNSQPVPSGGLSFAGLQLTAAHDHLLIRGSPGRALYPYDELWLGALSYRVIWR